MEKSYDPSLKLTEEEERQKRKEIMSDVDLFVSEMVQWCDSTEDLLSLGSILLVTSKNVMTAAMDLDAWKIATMKYIQSTKSTTSSVQDILNSRRY